MRKGCLLILLILFSTRLVYSTEYFEITGVKNTDKNHFFLCRHLNDQSFSGYVPTSLFKLESSKPFYISILSTELKNKQCLVEIGLFTRNTENGQFTQLITWRDKWYIKLPDSKRFETVYKKHQDKYEIEFISSGNNVGSIYLMQRSSLEGFKELNMSRSAPLWKFRDEVLLKF